MMKHIVYLYIHNFDVIRYKIYENNNITFVMIK